MRLNVLAVGCCLCLSIVTSVAYAQESNFKGPFGGILVSSVGSSTDAIVTGQALSTGAQTVLPTVEAGYNFAATEKFVLATSVTYDLAKTNGGNIVSASLQSDNHYSLNFKPGYAINDTTLLYATIGYNHRNATLTNAGKLSGYSFNGIGYGIGSMLMLNESVYLRFELQKINYDSQSIQSGVSAQPSLTVGTIGVGYKF